MDSGFAMMAGCRSNPSKMPADDWYVREQAGLADAEVQAVKWV
jgi:hypothetical protein